MNNNGNFEKAAEQAAAFQKIWADSMAKTFQAAFKFTPDSPPPELLKEIRSGIFSALAKSWEEFMRSPQFLEGMRQWMDQAVNFRKMTNDFMAKVRNDMQAPSRDDMDNVMLTVRHMEKRLLDRMEEMSAQIAELKQGGGTKRPGGSRAKPKSAAARAPGVPRRPAAVTPKTGGP
jgi:hypothetical protein